MPRETPRKFTNFRTLTGYCTILRIASVKEDHVSIHAGAEQWPWNCQQDLEDVPQGKTIAVSRMVLACHNLSTVPQ